MGKDYSVRSINIPHVPCLSVIGLILALRDYTQSSEI